MEGNRVEREESEDAKQHTQQQQQQSSYADLEQAIHENLKASGAYGKLLGRVRAEIFGLLRDEGNPPPTVPNLNFIVNELFKEYLVFNGYDNTLSVFAPESGQMKTPSIKRTLLTRELGLRDDETAQQVPLIYSVVEAMRRPNLADNFQNTDARNHIFGTFSSDESPPATSRDTDRHTLDESSGDEKYDDDDEDHFTSSREFRGPRDDFYHDSDQDSNVDAGEDLFQPGTVEFSA